MKKKAPHRKKSPTRKITKKSVRKKKKRSTTARRSRPSKSNRSAASLFSEMQARCQSKPRSSTSQDTESASAGLINPRTGTPIPVKVQAAVRDQYHDLKHYENEFWDYIPESGIWRCIENRELELAIAKLLGDHATSHRVRDVLNLLRIYTAMPGGSMQPAPNILAFPQGALDLDTLEIGPHEPTHYQRYLMPFDYDPNAICPTWDRVTDEWFGGDKEHIALLHQAFGYGLTGDNRYGRFFVFRGSGANGKSLALDIYTHLLGPESVAHVSLEAMNQRFGLAPLLNKRVNIVHEVDPSVSHHAAKLKTLVTEGKDLVEEKHEKAFVAPLPATHFLASNQPIRFRDASPGLRRRAVFLVFDRTFAPEERDHDLPEKLKAESAGIFNRILEGLRDLREVDNFTLPTKSLELADQFAGDQDPILDFVKEECDLVEDARVMRARFYDRFIDWRKEAGVPGSPTSRKEFYSRLHDNFPAIKPLKTNGGHDYLTGIRPARSPSSTHNLAKKVMKKKGKKGTKGRKKRIYRRSDDQ